MNKKPSAAHITLEKSRLNQARTLALRRNDLVEVAQIDTQLTALTGDLIPARPRSSQADDLARLNERNRKANMEAARKAEMLEAERKRRKLQAHANGTATPTSDRMKLLRNGDSRCVVLLRSWSKVLSRLRLLTSSLSLSTNASRPGTPDTPSLLDVKTAVGTPGSVSPSRPSSTKPLDPNASFEASVLDSVELDLGDF